MALWAVCTIYLRAQASDRLIKDPSRPDWKPVTNWALMVLNCDQTRACSHRHVLRAAKNGMDFRLTTPFLTSTNFPGFLERCKKGKYTWVNQQPQIKVALFPSYSGRAWLMTGTFGCTTKPPGSISHNDSDKCAMNWALLAFSQAGHTSSLGRQPEPVFEECLAFVKECVPI